MAELVNHPALLDHVRRGVEEWNADHPGSSTRIERLVFLTQPPDIDAGEITDKGYVNQRATLDARAAEVERLLGSSPETGVMVFG